MYSRCCCLQASLSSNGFFCRELKLETVALHSAVLASGSEFDELRCLFVRLLESLVEWQSGTESALESAGIDIEMSHDCQYIRLMSVLLSFLDIFDWVTGHLACRKPESYVATVK